MGLLQALFEPLFDIILPHRCFGCEELSTTQPGLCMSCWKSITFLSTPCCFRCGLPFEVNFSLAEETFCGECLRTRPLYHQARAVMKYDDQSKPLILRLKHADATHMVPTLAAWMARTGGELIKNADGLVAVPLHWQRQIKRQYNQAALLAMAISKQCHIPFLNVLKRSKSTPPQGHLTKAQRHANVKGAFAITTPQEIIGKNLVLIDDVMTTGATIESCCKALLKAGAKEVNVLTLARVTLT